MAAPPALKLYRDLLRQAAKFSSYNFRNYAFRKIRDEFVTYKSETNPDTINTLLSNGHKQLALINRQGTISQMYAPPDLVVEK